MHRAPSRSDRADRLVGWVVCLLSLPVAVWWLPDALAQWHRFPLWWNLAGWLAVACFCAMAVFGLRLPMRLLRGLWVAVPALLIALQLLSFGTVRGDPAEVLPWIWLLESVSVCLLTLQLRPVAAVAAGFASSLSVPLSAWIFTGGVSQLVLSNAPLRLSNIVLIALAIGARQRLARLHEAEAEASAAAERLARSAAEAEERARFSRFVHDDVLSVLTAAGLFRGAPPAELRAEAAATIGALAAERVSASGERPTDSLQAAELLRARLARLAPAAQIAVEADGLPVEANAIEQLGEATAEAVRNAVRHSRAHRIAVRLGILDGAIEISVIDDGIGFDASTVPDERLGVRQSIVARVSEAGGRARIASAPDEGTEVRLSWTP